MKQLPDRRMRIGELFCLVKHYFYLWKLKHIKIVDMNNLLIIGNGFDLAHNMKTSYNHFMERFINLLCTEKKLSKYIFDKMDIENYPELLTHIKNNRFNPTDFVNRFVGVLLVDMTLKNWSDIESNYFNELRSHSYYDFPEILNFHFDFVRKNLGDYLCTQGEDTKAIESYREMFNLIDSKDTIILNFNYTNTLKNLYSTEIKESRIIHIHGELSNPKNPIIFGYAANDEESRELIENGNNEYMRNIKKHLYKRTDNERRLTYYLKGTPEINVTILGHSCGLSDKLILNQILNDKNVKSINVFYFEEYEHYFQTQVNIDRIMNKDEHFTKLVDFNSSHRMPQYNDTPEQQKAFIDYITPIFEERKRNKELYDSRSKTIM